jgi:hypothetical protein
MDSNVVTLDLPMTVSDLVVAIPWIAFGVALLIVLLRLIRS